MKPIRVRVKICGITTPNDARMAAGAGADAVGLNFVAGPRKIDPTVARTILDALPPEVEAWALFDVGGPELAEPLGNLTAGGRISHVQMYGRVLPETVAHLRGYGVKTVAVRHVLQAGQLEGTSLWLEELGEYRPDLLLLDAGGDKRLGGTGETWDWNLVAELRRSGRMDDWPPIVLAGGLTPENVARAVRSITPTSRLDVQADVEPLRPAAPLWVDVASGVEESPGKKDSAKVRAFIQAARRVGC